MARIVSPAPQIDTDAPNPRTARIRPKTRLNRAEIDRARDLAKNHVPVRQIAKTLGHPVRDVEIALVPMRTGVPRKDRSTLNAGLAGYRFVMGEKRHGEAVWKTLDRLFTELTDLREKQAKI